MRHMMQRQENRITEISNKVDELAATVQNHALHVQHLNSRLDEMQSNQTQQFEQLLSFLQNQDDE